MQRNTNKRGFTIVELLIVIVVIGILAAITIVAYNGIQNRAHDTTVKSDLSAIGKKMALFHANEALYPSSVTDLLELGLKVNAKSYDTTRMLNLSYCRNADYTAYAIAGISVSGNRFYVSSADGLVEYTSDKINDGNREDINGSCSDILAGGQRLQGGYYKADTGNQWRNWTGVK